MAEGRWGEALTALSDLWRRQPSSAAAAYVTACSERMRPHLQLTPCRLALLRSFTAEPFVPLLRAAAFLGGIDLTVKVGEFNAYAQEILEGNGWLYEFAPDVAILAVETCVVAPELWEEFTDLEPPAREAAAGCVAASFRGWMEAFRARTGAALIVHNLETPAFPAAGVLEQGQAALIRGINAELERAATSHRGVYVLDYDGLVARNGRDHWHDERKWLTVRLPVRAEKLHALAEEWLRYLHPAAGRLAKVVVTDLDNTLWGGVIGEDGPEGIRLGREYPGAAYRALQRALLDLHHRGILLAIASKNNPEEAMRAIESHPEMLLRPQHFSAFRINWDDKAASLHEIAAELNVGLDALAFIDDNPAERRRIRMELPEVAVIELPEDPLGYARAVRRCPLFERLSLSGEDGERARHYAGRRRREEARRAAGSLDAFYHSLAQKVEVGPLVPETLARAAQLTQKTNQFNLTTRRFTEAQLAGAAAAPGCRVYTARVGDRFGDNGIVAVCMTRDAGAVCEIEAFLMSCRVIGRTIETALLSFLVEEGRARGFERLEGWFAPTRKNAPAADFYRLHGFRPALERDGATRWSLELAEARVACPPWIELLVRNGSMTGESMHA